MINFCLILFATVFWKSGAYKALPSSRKLTKSVLYDKQQDKIGGTALSKGIFGLTEAFGSLTNPFFRNDGKVKQKSVKNRNSQSLENLGEKIKKEYESIFWATGNMDTSLWTSNCTFVDPFSSFGGPGSTERFKKNADNLGKFVRDPKIKITSYKVDKDNYLIIIGWNFQSFLKLPWNPILAASGETSHYIDKELGLIYKYEERWKSKPWDVVKRIFIPTKN